MYMSGLLGFKFPVVSTLGRSAISRVCSRYYAVSAHTSVDGRVTVKPTESRKTFLIDSYKHMMEKSPVVLFLHYNNLMKNEDHHYRALVKQHGGRLTMLRNSLFSVYLKNAKASDPCAPIRSKKQDRRHPLLPLLKGPTAAITFAETSPASVARIFKALEKAQDKLLVVGAKVETEVYDVTQLNHFKTLPSKPELQAQLLGLLNVLGGAGLVRTLEAGSQTLYLTLSSHQESQSSEEKKEE